MFTRRFNHISAQGSLKSTSIFRQQTRTFFLSDFFWYLKIFENDKTRCSLANLVFWEQTTLGEEVNQFDLNSVMLDCSFCYSKNQGRPVMTLLDGSTWKSPSRLSTPDALKIQWKYCRDMNRFKYKQTSNCKARDELGLKRTIFSDRICDGIVPMEKMKHEGVTIPTFPKLRMDIICAILRAGLCCRWRTVCQL